MEPPVVPQENAEQARPVPPPPQSSAQPSMQLQYATPPPPGPWRPGPDHPVLRVIRQVVFAVGLGLLMYGVTSAIGRVNLRDAPFFAGWGATFVGLATPLWRVKKDEE